MKNKIFLLVTTIFIVIFSPLCSMNRDDIQQRKSKLFELSESELIPTLMAATKKSACKTAKISSIKIQKIILNQWESDSSYINEINPTLETIEYLESLCFFSPNTNIILKATEKFLKKIIKKENFANPDRQGEFRQTIVFSISTLKRIKKIKKKLDKEHIKKLKFMYCTYPLEIIDYLIKYLDTKIEKKSYKITIKELSCSYHYEKSHAEKLKEKLEKYKRNLKSVKL